MAILLAFDDSLMHELLHKNISYFIHAPRSSQISYAYTMANLTLAEQKKFTSYYKKKVDYVMERLRSMGAAMPDTTYRVEATFFVLGHFKDLFGLPLPIEAARALQRTGPVKTDEDIAYYLLFNDALMVTPLSYFGLPDDQGFLRITCSGNAKELKDMMDRLEARLISARK